MPNYFLQNCLREQNLCIFLLTHKNCKFCNGKEKIQNGSESHLHTLYPASKQAWIQISFLRENSNHITKLKLKITAALKPFDGFLYEFLKISQCVFALDTHRYTSLSFIFTRLIYQLYQSSFFFFFFLLALVVESRGKKQYLNT